MDLVDGGQIGAAELRQVPPEREAGPDPPDEAGIRQRAADVRGRGLRLEEMTLDQPSLFFSHRFGGEECLAKQISQRIGGVRARGIAFLIELRRPGFVRYLLEVGDKLLYLPLLCAQVLRKGPIGIAVHQSLPRILVLQEYRIELKPVSPNGRSPKE